MTQTQPEQSEFDGVFDLQIRSVPTQLPDQADVMDASMEAPTQGKITCVTCWTCTCLTCFNTCPDTCCYHGTKVC